MILSPPERYTIFDRVIGFRNPWSGRYLNHLVKRTKAKEKQAIFPIGDINKLTHYFKI